MTRMSARSSFGPGVHPFRMPADSDATLHILPERFVQTAPPVPARLTGGFFDASAEAAKGRAIFVKILLKGLVLVSLVIFLVFPIFWGALWKTPEHIHQMKGWLVVS